MQLPPGGNLLPRFQNQFGAVALQQAGIGEHLPPHPGMVAAVQQAEVVAQHVANGEAGVGGERALHIAVERMNQGVEIGFR